MIIKGKNNDITIEGAQFETKKATINQDEMSKLQYLLTKGLYSDPISAVIVEWTNNAVDSVVASGKDPVQNPVMVTITQNKFTVEDKGVGLTKEEFETICMNYLTSTKTESNAYIGSWGLGMKSFLSLNRSAIFTIVKNGIECKLLAYEGEEFLQYDLIHERKTEKADGVVAEVAINGWSEYNEWVRKAKKKLAYYDTVALFIEGTLVQNQIIRSADWQYSPLAASNIMHLCLKDVYYEINWDKLQIPGGIPIGIALRFGLDDGFNPTPSREALIWNEYTIKKVKEKIANVANWFAEKYNSNQKVYDNIIEPYNLIGVRDKHVEIGNGVKLVVNPLEKFTPIIMSEVEIKDVKLKSPLFYKNTNFLDEYSPVAEWNKQWKIKRLYRDVQADLMINGRWTTVLVNSLPIGRFKKYLLQKYKQPVMFAVKSRVRRMTGGDWSFQSWDKKLDLVPPQSSAWTPYIQEAEMIQKQYESLLKDERGTENTKEYADWIEQYEADIKANRVKGIYQGKTLNKKKGDVTVGYCRPLDRGIGLTFEKKTRDTSSLHQNRVITVCFSEDDKDEAKEFYTTFNGYTRIPISVVTVGKIEAKKLNGLHNYLTFKEFMYSKTFKKIATALLFKTLLDKYDAIYDRQDVKLIREVLGKMSEDIAKLRGYYELNGKVIKDTRLLESIKAIAKEEDLYDKSLWDVYVRAQESIEKYKFIALLEAPQDGWTEDDKLEIKSLINQVLYHRKTFRNQHPDPQIDIVLRRKNQPIEELNQTN